MNRMTPGLSALLLAAAFFTPAAAQQSSPVSASAALALCTGDYVCVEDASVVTTWPLERWDTVRRRGQAAAADPAPSSERQQLAGSVTGSPTPASP